MAEEGKPFCGKCDYYPVCFYIALEVETFSLFYLSILFTTLSPDWIIIIIPFASPPSAKAIWPSLRCRANTHTHTPTPLSPSAIIFLRFLALVNHYTRQKQQQQQQPGDWTDVSQSFCSAWPSVDAHWHTCTLAHTRGKAIKWQVTDLVTGIIWKTKKREGAAKLNIDLGSSTLSSFSFPFCLFFSTSCADHIRRLNLFLSPSLGHCQCSLKRLTHCWGVLYFPFSYSPFFFFSWILVIE